ncbi:hypothetical protein [Phytoactinopolyspora limicola]|uniref:hypothetical protein n=1 Tax=Phytoactinopolyspora limicola TaxID=2715536 RepID=UPI0014078336|nr:hypothetical protein [Phytoactinopolyspora limicola]
MNSPEADERTRSAELRLSRLEGELRRQRSFAGYARLYGPLAVLAAMLSFMPIFDDVVIEYDNGSELRRWFGSLWDMAGRAGGDPATLGILLVLIFTTLLVAATFRPTTVGLPVSVVVVAIPMVIMLVTRPGTGTPKPDLSAHGMAGMTIVILAVVIAVAQAAHVLSARRSDPPAGASR